MPIYNSEIADKFRELADLLEIKGANRFRVRAYRKAAQTISNLSKRLEDMIKDEEDLTQLSGIGKELSKKIKEIIETDELSALIKAKDEIPAGLIELLNVEGLGPKRVKTLYQELGVESMKDLRKAVKKGQVNKLEGFGKKTEDNIREAIKKQKGKKRVLLAVADEIVQPLINYLKEDKNIDRVEIAGSYRRRKETIGDFDILASSSKGKEVIDRFVKFEDVKKIVSKGETRSTIKLRTGMQVDLRVVPKKSFGAALIYFTGSKNHNIALRNLAIQKGLKVNEYGVFKKKIEKRIAGTTEKEIYETLNLSFIPPEIREDRGEIQAAKEDNIPNLIKLEDIKGDLHMHTDNSDGDYSIEKMVQMSRKLGREYVAITDHSSLIPLVHGLKEEDIDDYIKKVKKVDKKFNDISVLAGCEIDIRKDGSLFFKNEILKKFDIVLIGVHSYFNLDSEQQTQRIIKAIENPYSNILVHPTGRKIQQREPYEIDMERVMKVAKENNCFLEIDAQPVRLDLNARHARMAKEMGLRLAINTDSHSPEALKFMKYGVYQAQRGWLEASDVINTLNLKELKKLLINKRLNFIN